VDIHAPRYASRDYRRIGAAVHERDLGPNVRIRRRASLSFPSTTRQSRAALPSPIGWVGLAGHARPDVIHVQSFFGIGLEGLANGGVLRIPVIGTNHTTIAGFGSQIPVSVDRASAYVAWFYNRCDMVTAPSQSVLDELRPYGLRRPQAVVSNPIDTAMFRPVRDDERAGLMARFGLSRPTITYAGRLGPEKNIEILLHALSILRDRGVEADLAIAGHGSHEPILRSLAGDLRIADHVRLLGTLAQGDLAQLLRISDTFAIMSTSETQSMVLLQAMASGIPVIAARSRALPEFVGAENGILVDPHDNAALADAMETLLASPERRKRLGSGGRQSAARHRVETVTDAWEGLYGSMLQGSLAA